jgi:hypothetical protein
VLLAVAIALSFMSLRQILGRSWLLDEILSVASGLFVKSTRMVAQRLPRARDRNRKSNLARVRLPKKKPL